MFTVLIFVWCSTDMTIFTIWKQPAIRYTSISTLLVNKTILSSPEWIHCLRWASASWSHPRVLSLLGPWAGGGWPLGTLPREHGESRCCLCTVQMTRCCPRSEQWMQWALGQGGGCCGYHACVRVWGREGTVTKQNKWERSTNAGRYQVRQPTSYGIRYRGCNNKIAKSKLLLANTHDPCQNALVRLQRVNFSAFSPSHATMRT